MCSINNDNLLFQTLDILENTDRFQYEYREKLINIKCHNTKYNRVSQCVQHFDPVKVQGEGKKVI